MNEKFYKIVVQMQQVEINTSQNVKIEYQLATVGHRIFAFIIDFAILFIVGLILYLAVALTGLDSGNFLYYIFNFLLLIWIWFYTLGSEIIGNGQTIGKLALGIKVVKLNGDEMEFYDYFSRWSVRLFDVYFSVGALAMLLIASNKSGQRLGDIISGTTVIKKKNDYAFRLRDILELNTKNKDDYQFDYPNANVLNEKDVILIKNTLYRLKQYNNASHRDTLNELVDKVLETLGLDLRFYTEDQKVRFLNKVVSEYIILTR